LTELIAKETTAVRSSTTVEVDLVNTTLVAIDLGALIAANWKQKFRNRRNVADSD